MSDGPIWIGACLYQGRTAIGSVRPANEPGKWLGFSTLPGGVALIGRDFPNEKDARQRVEQSAASRVKAMFGAGINTTATAVSEGRRLRVVARAIYRAGVWKCDRPANASAMFEDLRRALGLPEDARPMPAQPGEIAEAYGSEPGEIDVID